MALVVRRTALFFAIIAIWALVAAAIAHAAPAEVPLTGYKPGTIVVKTNERTLYYVLKGEHALKFPVGVGKDGQQWNGKARVRDKYVKPAWAPPADIRRENPKLPRVVKGGASNNPMGVAALTLNDGTYAIHGTNRPSTIGHFVSHGCIRMYNEDIRKLYRLVRIGTPVIVEQ
jgi:lipoprotein-anchoring transpeptidase ErfK/SrfK